MPKLPAEWFICKIDEGVDPSKLGLYEWKIEDKGSYIGKYKRISRPLKHYTGNVRNLLDGKPYRKSKPARFRNIHHELADAFRAGRSIQLIILENAESDEINQREHQLIRGRGNLNGPRFR